MVGFFHTERLHLEPLPTPVPTSKPPVALTIAGHDPSSGAGITADLQVFQAHGIFGTSAITALTVQSTLGVAGVEPVSGAVLSRVLEHLNLDLPPQGIKIGMLGSAGGIAAVVNFLLVLREEESDKSHIPVVLDPVLKASSGAALVADGALEVLLERLIPAVDWITPNWSELALLSGHPVGSLADAEAAARSLSRRYSTLNVIVTGGDQDAPMDLVCEAGGAVWMLAGEHVETRSTHGTGCAFSTSFLANLIHGKSPLEASQAAKRYVAEALRRAPGIGHGRGPLHLLWPLEVAG